MKKVVLIGTIVLASIAVGCVLWARAAGRLAAGDTSPIFGVITIALIAVTVWASRVGPSKAKVD